MQKNSGQTKRATYIWALQAQPETMPVRHSDVFKLRASFFMTTSLTCHFYSKFSTHEDTAFSALEAYMVQLYISDNDTGSKLANGVIDTHGKFSAGVVDTGGAP
jgi:hypothetical protein